MFSVFLVNHSLWQDVLGRGDGFWQRLSSFPVRSQLSVAALLSPAPKSLCPGFMEAELGFAGLRIPWLCYTNC